MRCILIDPYATGNRDRLAALLETRWELDSAVLSDTDETLAATMAAAEAAISQGWNARLGRAAPNLRLLQLPNAGTDAVNWNAIPVSCAVCNVFEHETAVAEFVLLAMLESRIDLRGLDRSFRSGDWSLSHRTFGPRHGELAGATLGLVGYGRIGAAVARRAVAFGVNVVAVSRRAPSDPQLVWSADTTRLDDMLPRCDFVVIACPLNEETRGLIDGDRLALMRRSAVLINVARAEVVEEDALFTALKNGTIGGAALDVWWRYPEPSGSAVRPAHRPFWDLPGVLMSPHVAGWSEAMLARRWQRIAENLDRFACGLPLVNRVAWSGHDHAQPPLLAHGAVAPDNQNLEEAR